MKLDSLFQENSDMRIPNVLNLNVKINNKTKGDRLDIPYDEALAFLKEIFKGHVLTKG